MRVLLLSAVLAMGFLAVAAVVFRSRRARDTLRFIRRVLFAYVITVVVLATVEYWRNGL